LAFHGSGKTDLRRSGGRFTEIGVALQQILNFKIVRCLNDRAGDVKQTIVLLGEKRPIRARFSNGGSRFVAGLPKFRLSVKLSNQGRW